MGKILESMTVKVITDLEPSVLVGIEIVEEPEPEPKFIEDPKPEPEVVEEISPNPQKLKSSLLRPM